MTNGTAVIPTTTPQADFLTVPLAAKELPDAATGALYALVLLDLLRLLERFMRRRYLHLCTVEQLLDSED